MIIMIITGTTTTTTNPDDPLCTVCSRSHHFDYSLPSFSFFIGRSFPPLTIYSISPFIPSHPSNLPTRTLALVLVHHSTAHLVNSLAGDLPVNSCFPIEALNSFAGYCFSLCVPALPAAAAAALAA